MFNALSRNTRQSFMVLATAAAIVFATGAAVRGAVVLRGPAARAAVAKALLPFITQYRRITTVHFVAQIHEAFTPIAAGGQNRLLLKGRYKFWADGNRDRIDWRVLRSNFQPLVHQIWTRNGWRHEAVSPGPNSLLFIRHHRLVGLFGPAEQSPLLAPIFNLCQRRTPRQPGNWLCYWRVRHQPTAVDKLPRIIRVGMFSRAGPRRASFTYCFRHMRWPAAWPMKVPPPAYFRPGRREWDTVVLKMRQHVWLPVLEYASPAVRTKAGAIEGVRYSYRRFAVGAHTLFLPTREQCFRRGVWRTTMNMRNIQVGGRIDPALFEINMALAAGIWEHHRIVSFTHLPPAPARTQHLGNAAAGGRKK